MYEIKNNMYQTIKIIIDKYTSVIVPAKSIVKISINQINEHMEDLKRSGNITYKKI
jgi:hypothetical protein